VSKEAKEIKITDKRMFTPAGELREEYRFLDEKSTAGEGGEAAADAAPAADASAGAAPERGRRAASPPPDRAAAAAPPAPAGPAAPGPRSPGAPPAAAPHDEPSARLEIPGSPPGLGASFYDLVAMLAEPVAIYLGDVELPDGQSAENLEMARLHIDMLDVLRQKTVGNLSAHESAFLEDLLYRSRLRYVQKRG
jgi:hypothetical protein